MVLYTVEVTQLLTLMVDLNAICRANHIDWRLADHEAEIEAANVADALESVRTRLGVVYRAKFPDHVFDDDHICASFLLREGFVGPPVASGSVIVSNDGQTLEVDEALRIPKNRS